MTLYQFIAMDEMEQAQAIQEGTFIADRHDAEHRILLYQIDCFYVEVYYHSEYNVVRKYKPFASGDQLQPYLNKIDISEFIKPSK